MQNRRLLLSEAAGVVLVVAISGALIHESDAWADVLLVQMDTTEGHADTVSGWWQCKDHRGGGVFETPGVCFDSVWVPIHTGSDPIYRRLTDPPPPDSLEVVIPHPGSTVRVSIVDVAPFLWSWAWWPNDPVELWYREWMFSPPSVNVPADIGQAVVVRGWSADGAYFALVERLP